jgi:oxidase EvaA
MVTQKVGGVLHFLIRACFYPGNLKMFELGSTVSRSDYVAQFKTPVAPQFLDLFHDPSPDAVRFSSVQSEEGGRFFHYQNRYMILELPEGTVQTVPEEFMWMTLGQIQELMPHGYFNIEARNLLACLHLM